MVIYRPVYVEYPDGLRSNGTWRWVSPFADANTTDTRGRSLPIRTP